MIKDKDLFASVKRKYSENEIVKFYIEETKSGLQNWEDEVIRRYIIKKDLLVLSVGCGAGREPIALSRYNYEIIGIDIVFKMLQEGYNLVKDMNLGRVRFVNMNLISLGFQSTLFDAALLTNQVLTYIPRRVNRLLALKEIFRVLRPGGIIIMTTHSIKSHLKYKIYFAIMNPLRRLASLFKISTLEPGDRYFTKVSSNIATRSKAFLHMYTLAEGINDLEKAGFSLLNVRSRKEWLTLTNRKSIEKDYIITLIGIK